MQVMQKVLTTSWFFITCLLIFMQHILLYLRHIFILSILNRFCLLLHCLNPVGKKHVYSQEFVIEQCPSVRHNILSNCNSILGFLRAG